VAGRVGFFLRVEDFDAACARMTSAGVEFVSPPRTEPYGRVAVFLDIAGNRWDLLGPAGGTGRRVIETTCRRGTGIWSGGHEKDSCCHRAAAGDGHDARLYGGSGRPVAARDPG